MILFPKDSDTLCQYGSPVLQDVYDSAGYGLYAAVTFLLHFCPVPNIRKAPVSVVPGSIPRLIAILLLSIF